MTSIISSYLNEIKRNSVEHERSPTLIEQIKHRLNSNLDVRILMTGSGGVGKSYTSLRIGELIDPRFIDDPESAVKEQVCFKAEEFMASITRLPSKSVIIYDEPGQSFMGREFMSEANRLLAKTLIGFRFKRFCSIFCIPVLALIDKAARVLCQYKVDVLRHGYAEYQKVLPSRFHDDIWYSGAGTLKVSMPSVKLRHLYEEKKHILQDGVYAEYLTILTEGSTKKRSVPNMLDEIEKNTDKFMITDSETGANKLSINILMGALDIDKDKARRLKARYEYRHSPNNPNP